MQTQDFVKAGLFVSLACIWLAVRAWPAESAPAREPGAFPPAVVASLPPGDGPTDGDSGAPSPATTAPGAGTPEPSARASNPPAATKTVETPAAGSGLSEPELQTLLEADAHAYTVALQAADLPGIRARLARRCVNADVASLVARRRAEVKEYTGIAIERTTVIGPLVGHLDVKEGVAHAFLGLEYQGRRLALNSADGWLYEDGHWRNAEC